MLKERLTVFLYERKEPKGAMRCFTFTDIISDK